MWGHFLGRGFIEPIDDFRESNPGIMPELLKLLAHDFVANGYDLKHLLRSALNSRTYQLSAATNVTNAGDTKYCSHYAPRLQSAEQLLDAVDYGRRFTLGFHFRY